MKCADIYNQILDPWYFPYAIQKQQQQKLVQWNSLFIRKWCRWAFVHIKNSTRMNRGKKLIMWHKIGIPSLSALDQNPILNRKLTPILPWIVDGESILLQLFFSNTIKKVMWIVTSFISAFSQTQQQKRTRKDVRNERNSKFYLLWNGNIFRRKWNRIEIHIHQKRKCVVISC